ncbi:transposase [Pseudomonas sp. LPB0260]|uniref:transposase n=1 Tax=Pseudomonas sp. LPB0260 TaxID=2614442 RepID=UPI003531B97D
MKAHIGVDDESGLVHGLVGTVDNVVDVDPGRPAAWRERGLCGCRYTGVEQRPEHEGRAVIWLIAARRSNYKKLDRRSALYKTKRKTGKAKAQMRAKVEHPFRVAKRQFGCVIARFRGLVKSTAQLVTLFALSDLWMTRRRLLASAGEVRPKCRRWLPRGARACQKMQIMWRRGWSILIDPLAFKWAMAEVARKYRATSEHP